MAIHAAGYGRQSYGRANGSETSPAVQRTAQRSRFDQIRDEYARKDIEAVWHGHYEDIGISAYSGKERPDFERMLKDCRSGRINMIIVYNIARLSRLEPTDAIPIVNELLGLDVTIVSVSEGVFRKGNIMDLIHLIFRLDGAHQESKNKSIGVRGAVKAARDLGGYVGGRAPFGRKLVPVTRYNAEGKPVVIQLLGTEKKQAKLVQGVWDEIKRHKRTPLPSKPTGRSVPGSLGNIIGRLNRDGEPTSGAHKGKKTKNGSWHIKTLASILRHPHLAGFATDPVYEPQKKDPSKKRVVGHRIRLNDKGLPIQAWEPILEPGDWFELQAWLDERPARKWENRTTSLLSSMEVLYCESTCNRPMGANSAARPVGGSYFCSRPSGYRPKKGEHEGGSYISRAGVDEYVARSIFARLITSEDDPETTDILAAAAERFSEATEDPEKAQERQRVIGERMTAVRALEQLYDERRLYDGDEIGRRRWKEDVEAQQRLMKQAEERIAELGELDVPVLPITQWLSHDPDWDGDPIGKGSWWEKAPLDEKRALVKCFLVRITIRKAREDEKSLGNKAEAVIEPRVTLEWAKPQKRKSSVTAQP
ncbi:recombinase family protein [Streptomyces sp. NPDC020799]|uniref:recombinase family protein n=1 Tax=Streptomyces sp. NPDC020799 TaxID=3365091 RepID=UPI0037B33095